MSLPARVDGLLAEGVKVFAHDPEARAAARVRPDREDLSLYLWSFQFPEDRSLSRRFDQAFAAIAGIPNRFDVKIGRFDKTIQLDRIEWHWMSWLERVKMVWGALFSRAVSIGFSKEPLPLITVSQFRAVISNDPLVRPILRKRRR